MSSHEDFKKCEPLHEHNYSNGNVIIPPAVDELNFNSPSRASPHRDPKRDTLMMRDDDLEHEKRRSSERFSRPLAPPRAKRNHFGRKRKSKTFAKHREDLYYYKDEFSAAAAVTNTAANNNIELQDANNSAKVVVDQVDQVTEAIHAPKHTIDEHKSDLVSNFLQLHTTERYIRIFFFNIPRE